MKRKEKLDIIQKYSMGEWIKTRQIAQEEVSREHEMFCVCKRLCTGLHERNCRRFINKVNSRAIYKLKHLWKKQKVVCPEFLK